MIFTYCWFYLCGCCSCVADTVVVVVFNVVVVVVVVVDLLFSSQEIIVDMRESVKKYGLQEAEAVAMIWSAVMSATEWNKKEDLVLVSSN